MWIIWPPQPQNHIGVDWTVATAIDRCEAEHTERQWADPGVIMNAVAAAADVGPIDVA